MENAYDHCCHIVAEHHSPITGLDSNQFTFRFHAEQKRALQHDQLVSALSSSDTVDFEQIAADMAFSFGRKKCSQCTDGTCPVFAVKTQFH